MIISDTEKENLNKFIAEVIKELPSKYASVINLFYLEAMSCEEISEVMNISTASVKVILYRSRKALKDLLISKDYIKEII